MDDLFKDTPDGTACQSIGACSANPVLYALDAAVINEIRQTAYYIVKLKELNFTNEKIMESVISALCVSVTDTSFNKASFLSFFLGLKTMKEKIKDFYIEKCKEAGISYEYISSLPLSEKEYKDVTEIIKSGEDIIKYITRAFGREKICLADLTVFMAKTASLYLIETIDKNEDKEKDYFEVLRFLSLTNSPGVREEKLIRRIKEFSSYLYNLSEKLILFREDTYGKRQSFDISKDIVKGKSILVSGGNLSELYNVLKETKDKGINIYTDITMICAYTYPVFTSFENLKGVFGTSDFEYNFSNFKGAVYITRNSTLALDNVLRGKIFTTKLIPSDRAVKIEVSNLESLINETSNEEGFKKDKKEEKMYFEYDKDLIRKEIEEGAGKNFLITLGEPCEFLQREFKDYFILRFKYPYEMEGLIFAINILQNAKIAVYFSKCNAETIKIIATLFNKDIKIYLAKCSASNINPHITETLRENFKVEITD